MTNRFENISYRGSQIGLTGRDGPLDRPLPLGEPSGPPYLKTTVCLADAHARPESE